MFRCDNCGSGYSTQAASSWQFCPRCLAREKINVPLTFELGWRRRSGSAGGNDDERAPNVDRSGPRRPTSAKSA